MGLLRSESINIKTMARDMELMKLQQEELKKLNSQYFAGQSIQQKKAAVEAECQTIKANAETILKAAKEKEAAAEKALNEANSKKAEYDALIAKQASLVKQCEERLLSADRQLVIATQKKAQNEETAIELKAKSDALDAKQQCIRETLQKLV